ncbi:MAG: hypothetical protein JXA68_09945 [Ignavibacteriales bacterium]|nr:hypothetical protein [Ignavibacteriales bacterium]
MPEKIPAKEGTYMNKPIMTIYPGPGEQFPFTFGVSKARAILQYLDEIKQFVEKYGKKNEQQDAK